ncbi:hypothetical protein EUAN_05250 [Andreesenia angusta]|uniref:Flagellar hook-length control protein FliK n=1 Tax=Andreesenia angusta TaxID=39480 RepID=A0A1S1V813_9FIRM|nr:hypothetical protein [Andreesenia angusta]OHW62741.1 hypothetical protein EUAN_05250 [Andreesenia angusta]
MRINIPMVRSNEFSDRNMFAKLKPGDKIRGKVLEIKGDLVRLELRSGEVVYGKSEIPLDFSNEKFMSFIVKEMGDNILSLVPDYDSIELNDNYTIKNERLIMNKVLEFLGLEKSDENIELVKNMVKFNMPLDSDTVQESLKYMDKIISLLNIEPSEDAYVLSKNIDHMKEDLANFFKLPKDEAEAKAPSASAEAGDFEELEFKEINYSRDKLALSSKAEETAVGKEASKGDAALKGTVVQEGADIPEKANIERLKSLIDALDRDIKQKIEGGSPELEVAEKERLQMEKSLYKNVTDEVKSELQKLFPEGKLTEKDIQKLVFLNRAEVKVSIENLKSLESILKGESISGELESILESAVSEKLILPEDKLKLQNMAEKIVSKLGEKDIETIKEYKENINEILKEVSEKLSQESPKSEQLSKQIGSLGEKLDMYNKINEKSMFMFIPLNVERDEVKDKLYFMSKRRHGAQSETIRAYISLQTENLDRVSAVCDYKYGRLDISFRVGKEKVELFSSTKDVLKTALSSVGYSDVNINIKEDIQEDILDMMSDESSINYMINVKV